MSTLTKVAVTPRIFFCPTFKKDTVVVAGTPIGNDQFVHDFLARKRQEVHDELQRLTDLPHPLTCQDKWGILCHSMQLRLQHLSHTVPPATARPHLEQHAADLRCTALQICGQPDLHAARLNSEATCLQLHLPLRDGGFGIAVFPPGTCSAAFLSGVGKPYLPDMLIKHMCLSFHLSQICLQAYLVFLLPPHQSKAFPPSAKVNLSMHGQKDASLPSYIAEYGNVSDSYSSAVHANTQRQMCHQAGTQAVLHQSHCRKSSHP
jgi:hypothetical protein